MTQSSWKRFLFDSLILFQCLVLAGISLQSCNSDGSANNVEYVEIRGGTMGTTYLVRHQKVTAVDYTDSIQELLIQINQSVSTYIPESAISEFNRTGLVTFPTDRDGLENEPIGKHFMANTYESKRVSKMTGGAFDPTVNPLVNAWGFGMEGKKPSPPDSAFIDSLLSLVGMDLVEIDRVDQTREVKAVRPGVQLDFSAIAKGYAVDQVADFLEARGLFDYFVEIGGEVRVRGLSPRGDPWIVGINTPSPGAAISDVFARIRPINGAMATSGNYRNFYNIGGQRVWHTINPKTGYPQRNNLLSASIVFPRCIRADALATACMVLGYPECITLVEDLEETEGFFIYHADDGSMQFKATSGFSKYLIDDAVESEE